MPSVDNLRKQAKRIVRWHRDGRQTVGALIRAYLPAFGEMSDSEILAHRFQLADAQELVARQRGLSSWQALLQGAEQMPESPSPSAAKIALKRAEAQLLVTDLARSLSFFTAKLGFEAQFSYGEPPFYGQVARDGAYLNLRHVPRLPVEPSLVRQEGFLAATICVESIKELFLEFRAAGVEFHQSLHEEPWGARNFIVVDPDGNLILFAE